MSYEKEIRIIQDYLEIVPEDPSAIEMLRAFQIESDLGLEEGTLLKRAYSSAHKGFMLNKNLYACRLKDLRRTTHKQDFSVVVLKIGRLDFVLVDYYFDVEDVWKEFVKVIAGYEPLELNDRDSTCNEWIFDVEHGKKLMEDYSGIISLFEKKFSKKVNRILINQKKKEIEELEQELEEMSDV